MVSQPRLANKHNIRSLAAYAARGRGYNSSSLADLHNNHKILPLFGILALPSLTAC